MKSPLHSPNPCSFCTYKIRKNNPLHFQHLRHPLVSADSKDTSTPLDSAVTRPLFLTPLQSTLTKNRGRGVGVGLLSLLTKNSRNFACPECPLRGVYPERLPRGVPSRRTSMTEQKMPGCTPLRTFLGLQTAHGRGPPRHLPLLLQFPNR